MLAGLITEAFGRAEQRDRDNELRKEQLMDVKLMEFIDLTDVAGIIVITDDDGHSANVEARRMRIPKPKLASLLRNYADQLDKEEASK